MPRYNSRAVRAVLPRRAATAICWALLFLAASTHSRAEDPSGEHPLDVFDFYVGRIVPTRGVDWESSIVLERGVAGHALRFVGRWNRPDQPPEFNSGLIGWDPVDRKIRITGLFSHGAFFDGEVIVVDRERQELLRDWTGHYPDGRVIRFRERWTPVSDSTFQWKIERLVDGEWQSDLPPGMTEHPIHRVIKRPRAGEGPESS